MSSLQLYPHQEDLSSDIRACLNKGNKRILIYGPTGSGKTEVAASLIKQHIERFNIHFIVNKKSLLHQTIERFRGYGLEPDILGAGIKTNTGSKLKVATIQSIKNNPEPADIVWIDEAHCSYSDSYKNLIESVYFNSRILGLTATPERRSYHESLGDIYQQIVMGPTPARLIREGYLVMPKHFGIHKDDLNLSSVGTIAGDYNSSQLRTVMDQHLLIDNIVKEYKRLTDRFKRPLQSLCFAVDIKHSKNIRDTFNRYGIPAVHMDANTTDIRRAEIFRQFREKEIRIICSINTISEGFDEPSAECAILARPTKSWGLYIQETGRVLRNHPGKEFAVILDMATNIWRHGYITDDKEFSLEAKPKRKPGETPMKVCPDCHAIIQNATRRCPECGYEFPCIKPACVTPLPMKEVDDKYTIMKLEFARLMHECQRDKVNPNRAFHLFLTTHTKDDLAKSQMHALYGERPKKTDKERYCHYLICQSNKLQHKTQEEKDRWVKAFYRGEFEEWPILPKAQLEIDKQYDALLELLTDK